MKEGLVLLAALAGRTVALPWCVDEVSTQLGELSQASAGSSPASQPSVPQVRIDTSVSVHVEPEKVKQAVAVLSASADVKSNPNRVQLATTLCSLAGSASQCDCHCWEYTETVPKSKDADECRKKNNLPALGAGRSNPELKVELVGPVFNNSADVSGSCQGNRLTPECLGLSLYCDWGLDHQFAEVSNEGKTISIECNKRRERDVGYFVQETAATTPQSTKPERGNSTSSSSAGSPGQTGNPKANPKIGTSSTSTLAAHSTSTVKPSMPDSLPDRKQASSGEIPSTSGAAGQPGTPPAPVKKSSKESQPQAPPVPVNQPSKESHPAPVNNPPTAVQPPSPANKPSTTESGPNTPAETICYSFSPTDTDLKSRINAVLPPPPPPPAFPEFPKFPDFPSFNRRRQTSNVDTTSTSVSTGCYNDHNNIEYCQTSPPAGTIAKLKELGVKIEDLKTCQDNIFTRVGLRS